MRFVALMLAVFSLCAFKCDLAALVEGASEATTAYLRLLHLLAFDQKNISPDMLRHIAESPEPINPAERDTELLNGLRAHPMRVAFGERLRDGVEWTCIREGARAMLGELEGRVAKQEVAREKTTGILKPVMVTSNLDGELAEMKFDIIVPTVTGVGNALYMKPKRRDDAVAVWRDGKFSSERLPFGTQSYELVKSKDGRVFAVCRLERAVEIIDLQTAKSVRRIEGTRWSDEHDLEIAGEGATLALFARHSDGTTLDRVPFDGGAIETRSLGIPEARIHRAADGKIYAYGMPDRNTFEVRDVATGKVVYTTPFELRAHREAKNSGWMFSDERGSYFVTVDKAGTMRSRNLTTGEEKSRQVPQHPFNVRMTKWNDGESRIVFDHRQTHVYSLGTRSGAQGEHDIDGDPAVEQRHFALPDGSTFVMQEGKTIELGSGTHGKIDFSKLNMKRFSSIQTTPEGRVYGLYYGERAGIGIVQLFGPVGGP